VHRELYIYWRVATPQLAAALQATQHMQQQLQGQHPGLQARLLVRLEEKTTAVAGAAAHSTVMETYRTRGGITPTLQAAIAAAAQQFLHPWLVADSNGLGQRHVEVFGSADAA
jgi:Domain of unknown function (DUF4936)